MSEDDPYLLRMVIQQLGVSDKPAYRVVVYGDSKQPRHSDFSDAPALLDTLRAVIPDFDLSNLTLNPLAAGQGSMVFVGEIKLDKTQLSLLGLN